MKGKESLDSGAYLFVLSIFLLFGAGGGCAKEDEISKGVSAVSDTEIEIAREDLTKKGSVSIPDSKKIEEQKEATVETKKAIKQKQESINEVKREVKTLVEEKNIPVTFFDKMQGIKSKPSVFFTPYGSIEEGASMSEVMDVFGNPNNISFPNSFEIWYYDFGDNKKLFVYFVNGKVKKVIDRPDIGIQDK